MRAMGAMRSMGAMLGAMGTAMGTAMGAMGGSRLEGAQQVRVADLRVVGLAAGGPCRQHNKMELIG